MTNYPETRSTLLLGVKSRENREAWEEFVLIYRPVIYRMARRRGLQDADAQDLSQNVLARVSNAIARWEKTDENTRFRNWLSRVAKNAIFSALKRSPKDIAAGGSEVQEQLMNRPDISSDEEAELALETLREEYHRAAAIVRNDVNADTWQAFELTTIHGKSCEEVADLLGKSVGTVYASRSRVMVRLRQQVEISKGIES